MLWSFPLLKSHSAKAMRNYACRLLFYITANQLFAKILRQLCNNMDASCCDRPLRSDRPSIRGRGKRKRRRRKRKTRKKEKLRAEMHNVCQLLWVTKKERSPTKKMVKYSDRIRTSQKQLSFNIVTHRPIKLSSKRGVTIHYHFILTNLPASMNIF